MPSQIFFRIKDTPKIKDIDDMTGTFFHFISNFISQSNHI